jgi:ElaB/YqjD/DUF883 family membrane-anchored ribosome-binding protein
MAATKTARKPAQSREPAHEDGQTPEHYLREALNELGKARDRASEDVREGIDSAIERTRDAMKDAGSSAHEQVSEWRRALDKAGDDVRRELGILAVRAQSSPEALRAMSAEIRKRKAEITPSK